MAQEKKEYLPLSSLVKNGDMCDRFNNRFTEVKGERDVLEMTAHEIKNCGCVDLYGFKFYRRKREHSKNTKI